MLATLQTGSARSDQSKWLKMKYNRNEIGGRGDDAFALTFESVASSLSKRPYECQCAGAVILLVDHLLQLISSHSTMMRDDTITTVYN
jgi:hypothetical protein